MKKIYFALLIMVSSLFITCSSTKQEVKSSFQGDVPYIVAKNYFVKNNADLSILKDNKIETEKEFSKLFGFATVMGSEGKSTPIDFSAQYVIAIIGEATDLSTELEPLSLIKHKDSLTLNYLERVGSKQTFTIKPFIILIVDRKYNGSIILNKVIS